MQVVTVGEYGEPQRLLSKSFYGWLQELRQEEWIGLQGAFSQPGDPLGKAWQGIDRLQRKGAAPRRDARRFSLEGTPLKHHLHFTTL